MTVVKAVGFWLASCTWGNRHDAYRRRECSRLRHQRTSCPPCGIQSILRVRERVGRGRARPVYLYERRLGAVGDNADPRGGARCTKLFVGRTVSLCYRHSVLDQLRGEPRKAFFAMVRDAGHKTGRKVLHFLTERGGDTLRNITGRAIGVQLLDP